MKYTMYFYLFIVSFGLFAEGHGGHGGHHGIDWNILGGSIFNFFLLLGLLIYFTKKPIKEALRKRKEETEALINKYKIEKENAENKLNEYKEKLKKLGDEVEKIKEAYEKAAKSKEATLKKQHEENIERLKANYEKELETKMQYLHNELKDELMEKAVKMSEEMIVNKFIKDSKAEQEFIGKFKIS